MSEIEEYLYKEEEKPVEKINYFVFGIGNEGLEGVLDLEKEKSSLGSFQLRCRFNSQRNIKLYGIKTSVSALKTILEKSISIGY
jgi:hypothetical protein